MARYNLNDRPVPGSSYEPRLNPKIGDVQLSAKIGGIPQPDRQGNQPIGLPARSPMPVPGAG